MDHPDHVRLLRDAVPAGRGRTWADLGAGTGAFTLALADLLGPGGRIVGVDRDERALGEAVAAVRARFPGVTIEPLVADLARPETLTLPELDGVVAANSLHFLPPLTRIATIRHVASALRPGAPFVVVEYDTDRGNAWVPFAFSGDTWARIAESAGLTRTERLASVPSRFLGSIYSAVSHRPSAAARRA